MKILDIRGNLIKIESSNPVGVASLLKISENNQEYLAQVLYTENIGQIKTLFAKVLSNFATPLEATDITNISTNANCEFISTKDLVPNFGKKAEIVLGELSNEKEILTASKNFFDKKLVIVSENSKNAQTITENFAHQIKNIKKNTIVFDTEGIFDGIKLTAGKDFKLPLNEHAIQFIYDKYFSDITDESKAQVSDIFKELKEYASTVPYIPFKTFKTVIDDVFNYSQNISLFFFKTKLEQLNRANVFANTHEEIMNWASLSEFGPGTLIIDLSKVGKIFVSEYISLVIEELNKAQSKIYAFVKLEDSFTDKDFLKELLESSSVCISYITKSDFKYLSALKQNCASYIITGDVTKCDNFDYCKFLLKNLPNDKYILTGNFVSPVSLIFNITEVSQVVPCLDTISEQAETPTEIYTAQPVYETIENEDAVTQQIEEPESALELTSNSYEEDEEDSDNTITEDVNNNNNNESQYEEIPQIIEAQDDDIKTEDVVSTPIADYVPQNIFTEDDEENEENAIEEYSTEEVVQEEIPQPIYEAIPQEETDSTPEIIEDYTPVPEAVEELPIQDEEENNDTEIQDYIPEATPSSEEEDDDDALEPVVTDTLEEYDDDSELSFSIEEEETLTFAIQDEGDDSIEEPEAFSGIMDTDSELEFSLEEPDALEVEEEEGTLDYQLSTQDFSFASDDSFDESEPETTLDPNKTAEELLDEQIKRDVDKVYMATPKNEEEEDLSEDDLDFIEELVSADDIVVEDNNDMDASDFLAINNEPEENIIEDNDEPLIPVKNTATPAVPIYSAEIPQEAIVHSDPIQQGDRVIHVKFGIGVVEKIFSYGTKNFCSINFENIGRKVLDPNVTELKRA